MQSTNNTEKQNSTLNQVGTFLKRFNTPKTLIVIIIIFQIVILVLMFNPIGYVNQLYATQIVEKISKLTNITNNEQPLAIGTIGDNTFLPNIEALKASSQTEADVYKDAKDGDYVAVYSTKMIIYRDSENRIIYEGETPTQIDNSAQEKLVTTVIAKAKEAGIISSENAEVPQLRVITTELQSLKDSNSNFYNSAEEKDIIGIFIRENKVVLYRPSNESIIKSGVISIK